MSDKAADVFVLTDRAGRLLDPAVQATILAKYSRSPLSAREVRDTLTAEEADRFQDKWTIGYNHSSVAEMSAIPVCFEGVSIVASKFIESYQRAGYSEKSTRYQVFSRDSFVLPPGAPESMRAFAARFYQAYDSLMPRVVEAVARKTGRSADDRVVKARAFDNVRYLLPAGTGTSLGAEMNLRDVRYLIQDARGSLNPEIRAIGDQVFEAVSRVCPVLVQKAEANDFELPLRRLGDLPHGFDHGSPDWYVRLHRPHLLPDPGLVQASFESAVADRHGMSWSTFSTHMEKRGRRAAPKIFRSVRLAFDVMMDYGAYRDLQRHRRCEQFAEPLTADYGYLVPDDIAGTDMESEYRAAMDSISAYGEDAAFDPDLHQYVIPLGYLHRSIFEMDLQEVYYLTELRTQPQGHISYRRVAWDIYRRANERLPRLMGWCRPTDPTSIGEHH
jgi:thymidylate synthase ThyX